MRKGGRHKACRWEPGTRHAEMAAEGTAAEGAAPKASPSIDCQWTANHCHLPVKVGVQRVVDVAHVVLDAKRGDIREAGWHGTGLQPGISVTAGWHQRGRVTLEQGHGQAYQGDGDVAVGQQAGMSQQGDRHIVTAQQSNRQAHQGNPLLCAGP